MAAQTAENAFLAESAEIEAVAESIANNAADAENPTNDEIKDAIDAVVAAARVDLNDELVAGTITADTTERSELALIADTKEALEKELADAQEAVAEVRGLNTRIDAVQTRGTQYEAALISQADADEAYGDQSDVFELLNTVTLAGTFGTADITDGAAGVILELQENGTYALGDAAKADGIKGANDLLNVANALIAADNALDTADTNLTTAVNRVLESEYELQEAGAFTAYADVAALVTANVVIVDGTTSEVTVDFDADASLTDSISQDLLVAKIDLADFTEALEAYQAIRAVETELASLEQAATDALEALEDAGFAVQLIEGGVAGTLENDVFLFQEDTDATDFVVTGFGDEGEDSIFFGEGFTLVQLGAGESIEDRVGSSSELEIFWEQDGTDLILYVEAGAEAGRDLDTDEITTITLANFSADDITGFANGYLTAGTVEVA